LRIRDYTAKKGGATDQVPMWEVSQKKNRGKGLKDGYRRALEIAK